MDRRAQTESIGVVLMVAIVVVTATTAGALYLSTVGTDEPVTADVSGRIAEHGVVFRHQGGEALPMADLRVVVRGDGGEWRPDFTAAGVYDGDADSTFEPGERWANVSVPFDDSAPVEVYLIDTRTNTVLVHETQYPGPVVGVPTATPTP